MLDEQQLNEKQQEESAEVLTDKQVKSALEAQELLKRVLGSEIYDIRDRVAYILSSSADARNSDIKLAWRYWTTFESDVIGEGGLTEKSMLKLSKISSLCRVRAKIQNEYKLFQADASVKKRRGTLEDKMKEGAIEDKPNNLGLYSVFIDESGKNDKYLMVGSLWLLRYGPDYIRKDLELKDWKKHSGITYEFHFTDMRPSSLEQYKSFFLKFLSLYPEVGFKLIVVKNKGFTDVATAITDLTFHLLSDGVEHEHTSGRAPLPRKLDVTIDDEDLGSDAVKLANIKERFRGLGRDGLFIGDFHAAASGKNLFIQAVDLFVASVNRKLNQPGDNKPKDQLADFILNVLNLNLGQSNYDKSTVFELSDFKLNV
ncbi:DUF3800 domain-containing protein [Pedobacter sp. SG918]|uniref:DUF3800 domain-containing protein n=1 Tax=Pedobacter sp. SG918 TaxID=2587136 RepID=UPI00146AC744|nr:DUF3800 domain-containing protein [Pedobacter sp. SG918]NMN37730.1 hypothetical protein [Pedobacter sp. SG918]